MTIHHTETIVDPNGDFTQIWHTPPPPAGTPFIVVRDVWTLSGVPAVRNIYEYRLATLEATA